MKSKSLLRAAAVLTEAGDARDLVGRAGFSGSEKRPHCPRRRGYKPTVAAGLYSVPPPPPPLVWVLAVPASRSVT